jgi:PAS domain-containing protein
MLQATGGIGAVPIRPWALTDVKGVLLDASDDVGRLVNVTRRKLIGRNLLIFFDRDRELIELVAAAAARGQPATLPTRLRPRDRKPIPVRILVQAEPERSATLTSLRWTFEKSDERLPTTETNRPEEPSSSSP